MPDYEDEDICCLEKDCVGGCLADTEECFCECHSKDAKHAMPCCFICPLCGIKIKIGLRSVHSIRCRVSSGC